MNYSLQQTDDHDNQVFIRFLLNTTSVLAYEKHIYIRRLYFNSYIEGSEILIGKALL